MSKKQKLLRKRFESQKASQSKNDELDQEDVKVKYSIVYFNWAVSDNEDEDSEDDDQKVKNITLPFRKMSLKK